MRRLSGVSSNGVHQTLPKNIFLLCFRRLFFTIQCEPIFNCNESQLLTAFSIFHYNRNVCSYSQLALFWFDSIRISPFYGNAVGLIFHVKWSDHILFNCITTVGAIQSTRISSLRGSGRKIKRKREREIARRRVHTTFMCGLYSKKEICKAPPGEICMRTNTLTHAHAILLLLLCTHRDKIIFRNKEMCTDEYFGWCKYSFAQSERVNSSYTSANKMNINVQIFYTYE